VKKFRGPLFSAAPCTLALNCIVIILLCTLSMKKLITLVDNVLIEAGSLIQARGLSQVF